MHFFEWDLHFFKGGRYGSCGQNECLGFGRIFDDPSPSDDQKSPRLNQNSPIKHRNTNWGFLICSYGRFLARVAANFDDAWSIPH